VSHFAIHDEIILRGLVLCLFHVAGSIPQMSRLVSGQFSEVQSLVFLQRGSGKLPKHLARSISIFFICGLRGEIFYYSCCPYNFLNFVSLFAVHVGLNCSVRNLRFIQIEDWGEAQTEMRRKAPFPEEGVPSNLGFYCVAKASRLVFNLHLSACYSVALFFDGLCLADFLQSSGHLQAFSRTTEFQSQSFQGPDLLPWEVGN